MSRFDLFKRCPKCGQMLMPGQSICHNCKRNINECSDLKPEDAKSVLIILIALLVVIGLIYLIKKSFF